MPDWFGNDTRNKLGVAEMIGVDVTAIIDAIDDSVPGVVGINVPFPENIFHIFS